MKIGKLTRTNQDTNVLLSDLDRLDDWWGRGKMEFSVVKCRILSDGRNNSHYYFLNETRLPDLRLTDLDILVSSDDLCSRSQYI